MRRALAHTLLIITPGCWQYNSLLAGNDLALIFIFASSCHHMTGFLVLAVDRARTLLFIRAWDRQ